MAILTIDTPGQGREDTITTNVSLIRPADDIRVVWFRPAAAAYFAYRVDVNDGDAGSTLSMVRFPVAAGEAWPLVVLPGLRIAIWSASGSIVANLWAPGDVG